MNPFLRASEQLVNRHGIDSTIIAITEGVYDETTLTTTNAEVSHVVKLFKNHIKSSQYSYPNLMGKEITEFYLANNNLVFIPKVRDLVIFDNTTFNIEQVQEHHARGQIVLYTIIASKG
ncbi:MAG: hypothetical protein ACRDBG_16530 [Waterburya sp.]